MPLYQTGFLLCEIGQQQNSSGENNRLEDVVNIWTLAKDSSIKHLLLLLSNCLGSAGFRIESDAAENAHSVYLAHAQHADIRAYISTVGQAADHYSLHLEFPSASSAPLYEVYENLSFNPLMQILAVHFDIPEVNALPQI